MGKYTAWDNPSVDRTVEDHLQQIVRAICSRIEPRAIVLRGSFSYGEGSIIVEGDDLRFLSDYELMAVTPHYRHRRWLQTVARQMTDQLGVETSISRVHPQNIIHNSLGNLPIKGMARPTIGMYEVQNAGLTLYGEHLLNRGPVIDPRNLDIWVGLRLLLNRMAESLERSQTADAWEELRWINKTVLSCADALLIVHGQYHFSYAERGRRFANLVSVLGTVLERASCLPDLVRRATAFKLRPYCELYREPVSQLWQQVRQACDATLRYVIEKYLSFSYNNYAEFPQLYLDQLLQNRLEDSRISRLLARLSQNLLLSLKFVRARRCPPVGLFTQWTYPAYQIVYSLVPLMFLSSDEAELQETRHWLKKLARLESPRADYHAEWNYLRNCTVHAWKDLCYGMWGAIS